MTQQELELGIGASFGHISRIESGKINPTKETLLKIAEVLKLKQKEINYLLGVGLNQVILGEIQEALAITQNYFNSSPYPSYLADDRFFVYNWNNKMLELLGVSPKRADLFRGINILEILFNPQLEFRKTISPDRWEGIALNELIFFIREIDYVNRKHEEWLISLIRSLKRYEEFEYLWVQAQKNFQKGIIPGENLIYFCKEKRETCFFMSVFKVNLCPRFRITEYIPHDSTVGDKNEPFNG